MQTWLDIQMLWLLLSPQVFLFFAKSTENNDKTNYDLCRSEPATLKATFGLGLWIYLQMDSVCSRDQIEGA